MYTTDNSLGNLINFQTNILIGIYFPLENVIVVFYLYTGY